MRQAATFPATAALRPIAWILAAVGLPSAAADPDLWGHVRYGLDFLHSALLPRVDPYSFTQDIPWTNHEWLSEAIMATAYAAAGARGLVTLKAALLVCTYAVVASALGRPPRGARWGALALVAAAVLPIAFTIRPQLWTLLLLVSLCRLLTAPAKYRWYVPLLFVPWVNLHGGWIVGLGVLAIWSASMVVKPSTGHRTQAALAAVVGLALLATLVNPYGPELWQFLLRTVRLSRVDIQEWQPLWRVPLLALVLWGGGVGFAGWVLSRNRGAAIPAAPVIAMLAVASVLVIRLVPLFVAATVMLLVPAIGGQPGIPPPRARTVLDLAAAAVVALLSTHPSLLDGCITVAGDWMPDIAAARSLRASSAHGRLITWFDWGEYALWHLSPALKVSYDGRRETVYSNRMMDEQRAIAGGDPEGLAALARVSPEYVWLSNAVSGRTKAWLREHEYRIDVDTTRSFVAVRADLQPVRTAAAGASACFPAP